MQCPQTARFFGPNVEGDSDARCRLLRSARDCACATGGCSLTAVEAKRPRSQRLRCAGVERLLYAHALKRRCIHSLHVASDRNKPARSRAKKGPLLPREGQAPWRSPWRGEAGILRSDGGLRTARARGLRWGCPPCARGKAPRLRSGPTRGGRQTGKGVTRSLLSCGSSTLGVSGFST